jgi:hypothetical protein
VYRLRLHNGAEYLLRTYGSVEMEHWIVQLNYAAALLSPQVSYNTAFESNEFIRPTYPLNYTTSNDARQQLDSHLSQLAVCMTELSTLQNNAPPKSAKGKVKFSYEAKHDFLTAEIERLKTYVRLLEIHLNGWDTSNAAGPSGTTSLPNTQATSIHSSATISPGLIPPQLVAAALDKDDRSFLQSTRDGALVYDVL